MQHSKFITVESFDTPALAHLAKSRLEEQGIRCFLDGEHHVSTNWLISNAVGGIKLVVDESDYETAKSILEQDNSEDLDSVAEFDTEEEFEHSVKCPRCQSVEIDDERYHRKSIFWSIILLGFPIPFGSKTNKCLDCGLKWIPDE